MRGEKLDTCWISNELYKTQNEIYGKHINHSAQIAIPVDSLGILHKNDFDEVNPKSQLTGECHLSIEFPKNSNMPKAKIDELIQKTANYIGSFLNKETVKLIEASSSEMIERYKIALPNNRTQLKRAINSLLNIRTTEASQNRQLFTLKKPILKDWNEDLMFDKKHILDTPTIKNRTLSESIENRRSIKI